MMGISFRVKKLKGWWTAVQAWYREDKPLTPEMCDLLERELAFTTVDIVCIRDAIHGSRQAHAKLSNAKKAGSRKKKKPGNSKKRPEKDQCNYPTMSDHWETSTDVISPYSKLKKHADELA